MSERRAFVLTAGVLVLTALAVVGIILFTDEEPDRAPIEARGGDVTTTSERPPPGELDAGGEELVALLAQGRAGRWHARYATSASEGQGAVETEVWRDGERARQDTRIPADEGRAEVAVFDLPELDASCTRDEGTEWACVEIDDATASASTDLWGTAESDLRGVTVIPRDSTVDGRAVRCFAFNRPGGQGDICVTAEGVPVTLDAAGGQLRLAELHGDFDGAVFEPPAAVTPAP